MTKKVEVKPFQSVKSFLKFRDAFDKAKALLDANLKYFKKRFGDAGGQINVADGILSLTEREPNGKESPAYKAMLEDLEKMILDGYLYNMKKGDAAKFMLQLRERHTKPQMTSQKIEAEYAPS